MYRFFFAGRRAFGCFGTVHTSIFQLHICLSFLSAAQNVRSYLASPHVQMPPKGKTLYALQYSPSVFSSAFFFPSVLQNAVGKVARKREEKPVTNEMSIVSVWPFLALEVTGKGLLFITLFWFGTPPEVNSRPPYPLSQPQM